MNTSSKEAIYEHLKSCSNDFIPPLHSTTDLQAYSDKLELYSNRFEAWDGTELVGLVAAYFNDASVKRGFITNVSVDPRYQRLGLGNHLMTKCIESGRELGFETVELEVHQEKLSAISIYQKLGFVCGDIRDFKTQMKLTLIALT